jgi:signal transduction histidine kinase
LDLNDSIREVIALTGAEAMKNGVSVRTQLADGLPLVEGDRVQLQQVMLNLIMNAIAAMRGLYERPRELLIKTSRGESGAVLVAVQDSGPGIDRTNYERVFDVFFTTKSDGLGMGLSIYRSIIEALGGRIWARNCNHEAPYSSLRFLSDGPDEAPAEASCVSSTRK